MFNISKIFQFYSEYQQDERIHHREPDTRSALDNEHPMDSYFENERPYSSYDASQSLYSQNDGSQRRLNKPFDNKFPHQPNNREYSKPFSNQNLHQQSEERKQPVLYRNPHPNYESERAETVPFERQTYESYDLPDQPVEEEKPMVVGVKLVKSRSSSPQNKVYSPQKVKSPKREKVRKPQQQQRLYSKFFTSFFQFEIVKKINWKKIVYV